MRVLDESLVEHRITPIGFRHDRREIVRDHHVEYTVEERPRSLTATDHVLSPLAVAEPHEHVPRPHRGEHQRPHLAPLARLIHEKAELTEIDLDLAARHPIGQRNRRRR